MCPSRLVKVGSALALVNVSIKAGQGRVCFAVALVNVSIKAGQGRVCFDPG